VSGFYLGIIDRAPIATASIVTGSAVTGYPIQNLCSTYLAHQGQVSNGGSAVIKLDLGSAPSTSSDVDYAVNYFSLHNHNLDGCIVTLKYDDAGIYASASTAAFYSLTNYAGFPGMMLSFAATSHRYWYLSIAAGVGSVPATVKIGHLGLGYGVDIGHPLRQSSQMSSRPANWGGDGNGAPPRLDQPDRSFSGLFRGMSALTDAAATNFTKANGVNYVAYNPIVRAMNEAFQISLSSGAGTRTGLCCGSGRPMPYHRGDQLWQLSPAGRPAGYGTIQIDMNPFWARDRSAMQVTITDVRPYDSLVKPGG